MLPTVTRFESVRTTTTMMTTASNPKAKLAHPRMKKRAAGIQCHRDFAGRRDLVWAAVGDAYGLESLIDIVPAQSGMRSIRIHLPSDKHGSQEQAERQRTNKTTHQR